MGEGAGKKLPIYFRLVFRLLAACYAVGFFLHVADLFGYRLRFSDMDAFNRAWILFLLFADAFVAVELWRYRARGKVAWVFVACAQLIAYVGFPERFGDQDFLVGFHLMSFVVVAAGLRLVGPEETRSKLS